MEGTAGGRADRNSTRPARLPPYEEGQRGCVRAAEGPPGAQVPTRKPVLPKRDVPGHVWGERGLGGPRSRQQPRGALFWGSRGGHGPIPHLPEDAISSCVRRTRMSVQYAMTAGSSSAVTAAPGPSTWPACPHHSGRFPGEPPHLPSTGFAGGLYPLTLSGRTPRSLSSLRMGSEDWWGRGSLGSGHWAVELGPGLHPSTSLCDHSVPSSLATGP